MDVLIVIAAVIMVVSALLIVAAAAVCVIVAYKLLQQPEKADKAQGQAEENDKHTDTGLTPSMLAQFNNLLAYDGSERGQKNLPEEDEVKING